MSTFESLAKQVLAKAGVAIDGPEPWDIQVNNPDFYRRVLTQGSLGLGESYLEGWWDCRALDELFFRIIREGLHRQAVVPLPIKASRALHRLLNMQNRARSKKVIDAHYDGDSEFLLSFTGKHRQYSCAYFDGTDDLDEAQERKLDLVCRKLSLTSRDRVLDIGCGYGGFARFAAERFGCEVTGITPSGVQVEAAREFCRGLPVKILKADYRDFSGAFTKIVSVGMFEHVGYKNYRAFMAKVRESLEPDGLLLLHTMGGNTSVFSNDPWIDKYYFTRGMLPSLRQIAGAAEGLLVLEDLHNLGPHYDRTLTAWHGIFVRNRREDGGRLDERVYRKWEYYFLHLAGCFRARKIQLWQFVYSKDGLPGGCRAAR